MTDTPNPRRKSPPRKPLSNAGLAFLAHLGATMRETRGPVSASTIADQVGIHVSDLTKMERGETNAKITTVVDALAGYGLQLVIAKRPR